MPSKTGSGFFNTLSHGIPYIAGLLLESDEQVLNDYKGYLFAREAFAGESDHVSNDSGMIIVGLHLCPLGGVESVLGRKSMEPIGLSELVNYERIEPFDIYPAALTPSGTLMADQLRNGRKGILFKIGRSIVNALYWYGAGLRRFVDSACVFDTW